MRLRTRLIVAFLILSVVPLGAVTYYSYTSQVSALREVASREADALSTDMTQRMQLVTTELSSRVEQLVDMQPVVTARPARPAAAKPAAQVATAQPVAETPALTTEVKMDEAEVSQALGAAAMLLRSVELQGMRRAGGPRPPGGSNGGGGRAGNEPRLAQTDPRAFGGDPRFPRPQPAEGRSGRGNRQGGPSTPPAPLTSVGVSPMASPDAQARIAPSGAVAPPAQA